MSQKREMNLPVAAINAFCKRWKIREFSIFGSILRDDFGPHSDIDVLVSFSEGAQWGLFEFVDMKEELGKILGSEVGIVEKEALKNPFRKHNILSTRKVIYAA